MTLSLNWILAWMVLFIGGSWLLELVLPQGIKDRLGSAICWGMMFVTMSFLTLSTVGLVFVIFQNQIRPLLAG